MEKEKQVTAQNDKKIFVSYSYEDKEFVEWLQASLAELGFDIWYDQQEIALGDSIKQRISEGIKSSSAFIVVLSKASQRSKWVRYELNSALLGSAINKGIKILPIKIDDSDIPYDLSSYLYADFSKDRLNGLDILKKSLAQENKIDYEFQDWSNLDGKNFESLVYELLIEEGFNAQRTPPTRDGGIDFIAQTTNAFGQEEKILIESKFYKNAKISIDTIQKLYALSSFEKANKVLLVTNSELTNGSKAFLKESAPNIYVWEGHELTKKLFSHSELVKKYFPKKKASPQEAIKLVDKELHKVQMLIKRLDECPEGKDGWTEYEDICIDVLNHLFVPPLSKPKIQSRRESGIDVRDAVYPNRNDNQNWKFIRDDYDAKYIVFEFKNYSENGSEIDKQVLLQINDYLKKTIGRFGVICSKKEPNRSGLEKRKDIFIEDNKLIIFLSNEHLKEMLLRKYKKLDPADVIIDLIDDFNLKF